MWTQNDTWKLLCAGSLIGAFFLAFGAWAPSAAAQGAGINIAVVDLEYVVAQSPAGKELQGKLEKFQQEVRGEVENRTNVARDIQKRLAEGVNSLAEDKLSKLQQEYEDATIAIRRYRDDKTREGQKMQSDGLKEIEQQLEPIFEKIRAEGNYDLILNNVPGVVVMAGERVDITLKVIERLKAETGS